MSQQSKTRRGFIQRSAQVSAAVLTAPYVHTSRAAGTISIGFWDHWVPGANKAVDRLSCKEWADEEQGRSLDGLHHLAGQQELLLTTRRRVARPSPVMTCSPSRPGLPSPTMPTSCSCRSNDLMEPTSSRRTARSTAPSSISARPNGKWLADAGHDSGSQIKGPCSRIDLMKKHAGIDIQAMYPAGQAPKADELEPPTTFLKAAEACPQGVATRSASAWARRRTIGRQQPARCSMPSALDARQRQGRHRR